MELLLIIAVNFVRIKSHKDFCFSYLRLISSCFYGESQIDRWISFEEILNKRKYLILLNSHHFNIYYLIRDPRIKHIWVRPRFRFLLYEYVAQQKWFESYVLGASKYIKVKAFLALERNCSFLESKNITFRRSKPCLYVINNKNYEKR